MKNMYAKQFGLIFLTLVLGLTSTSMAQRGMPSRNGRNSNQMKKALKPLVELTEKSICRFKDGPDQVALGTIVSKDGMVVTKLSEIESAQDLKCVIGEVEYEAAVVARLDDYDLAMVKIEAVDKDTFNPIKFGKDLKLSAGNFVLSSNNRGELISIGIVSVPPRKFEMRVPRASQNSNRGFLGIVCRSVEAGLEINDVTSRSGAQRAGLRQRDVLLEFEGNKVAQVSELIELLEGRRPNDEVSLLIKRDEKSMNVKVRLGRVPAGSAAQDKWGGGPFSGRRFGFPKVIAHDCAIRPNQCGGPLMNSDGQVVGINIARALRVSSYAIPIDVVEDFVNSNQAE